MRIFLALILLFSGPAFPVWAAPVAGEAYPSLAPAKDGRPQSAAHYQAIDEDGKISLAVQVLAPGARIEGFRIDNLGGKSSLWRSDSQDGGAQPLIVARRGETLADGLGKMSYGPLGQAEDIFELTLVDNGAFKDKKTDFRITVFLADGKRAFSLLKGADQPQARKGAVAAGPAPATDIYESFTLLMDTLSGPAQWSVQGHEVTSDGLTVKGLKIVGQIETEVLDLEDIFIKGLPSKSQTEKLMEGQPETLLVEVIRLKGIRLEGTEAKNTFMVNIGELNLEEVKLDPAALTGAMGSFKLADLKGRLTNDDDQTFTLDLAELRLNGLEAGDYLFKVLAGQPTLAGFFISPVSLEEAALTGLALELPGLGSLKLAELKATGPHRAGQVPASTKNLIKGLELTFTGDPQAGRGTPERDIYEFRQQTGLSALALEAESESAYEAGTGLWTIRLSRLSARDLFDLSLSLTLGGLVSDRLEKFKMVPLAGQWPGDPGDTLGDSSFNALNLKYTDHSLVDLAFNLAAEAAGAPTGAEFKAMLITQAVPMLMAGGSPYLKDPEALVQLYANFLKEPQSLEIDLKPTPPLTFKMLDQSDEPSTILNALNITLSVNGGAGLPLSFVDSLADISQK